MVKQFSPSTNILDNNIDFTQYIITSNVQAVFDEITSSYASGFRSFNLVGAYGTGKSTFLSALECHLQGQKLFFDLKKWFTSAEFVSVKIVGSYDSILEKIAETLGIQASSPSELLSGLDRYVKAHNLKGNGVLLIIDEFGKFLEYAAAHNSEKELYLLQQLAEYANTKSNEFLLITTLHQDFSAYAGKLSKAQKNEWVKVKGRFNEIIFNEPVEQLLFLAGKRLNGSIPKDRKKQFDDIYEVINESNAFPLRDFFNETFAEQLYPLDILSAATLALALQEYGQNERSLFTFLDSDTQKGINGFDSEKNSFYSLSHVYDYLNQSLHSIIKSKLNPDYSKWAAIRIALERAEGEFAFKKHSLYFKIIKTIGLLNIFSSSGAKLDEAFLQTYVTNADGEALDDAIQKLSEKQIIRYNPYAHRYNFTEGTSVDIDEAIQKAAADVTKNADLIGYLTKYFSLSTVSAKRAYFEYGTPRIFEYRITEELYNKYPEDEIDGFINLIFNDSLSNEDIKAESKKTDAAILYGNFKNSADIKHLVEDIQKAEIVTLKYPKDRVVQQEMGQIIDLQKSLLTHLVLGSFFNEDIVQWFFRGEKITVNNSRAFNTELSNICQSVYWKTPVLKSELINKSKLSPAVGTARKELLKVIVENPEQEYLGIEGFPPEKSIYLSLLKETNIHAFKNGQWQFEQSITGSFRELFDECNRFIEASKGAERTIDELYTILSKQPFKLKRGFLDFWIPICLFIRNESFALYGKNGFVPDIDFNVLELLIKNPKDYHIKAFDSDGIRVQLFNKYREFLSLEELEQTSNESFIKTVVPFIKFYKDLKEYTKQTKKISKKAIKIRSALANSIDPERLFFEQFPEALGYDIIQLNKEPELLKKFIDDLQTSVRELRGTYDELLNRFEAIINSLWDVSLDFNSYKPKLRARYDNSLKQSLLLPRQKTFYDRLLSPLDDRNAWLSSVSQSVIGKTLDRINDDEEHVLYDKFLNAIHELDNLNDIYLQNVDLNTEDVFKLEITQPQFGLSNKIIRLPKPRTESILDFEKKLEEIFSKEQSLTKIAILANLLKKELENERN
ncbi:ATP-binding protein [Pedobacter sp. MC2016-14]|uniref:ATP-binding protein n=1 Tax=Pedobacter sp. MC2016-14 TaxID=2897327 RepID=UPI001E49BC50|nr:ATP-binding protein [Pedobacter sp. MC2016-14]MCD0487916.1 ATP-binding protein [Pedobacter sp. MC2016-14]